MARIPAPELRRFTEALLIAGGFTPADAAQMADLLVWANLRGVDSHGVLRVPRYVEMLEQGIVRTGAPVATAHRFGAVTVLDGGDCPGAVGMNAAVDRAVAAARDHGVGVCAARAISHAGAVGYFASAVTRAGMVGIVTTASKPLMSYHGARGEALSTNPLAIAVPMPGGEPVVLDMSTAAVALGKIMAARDAGRTIPEGWAVDAAGRPTTDPGAVAALLPMAGAKGSGLSLMIEILTSVLPGNPVIAPALAGQAGGGFNGLVIALAPGAFGDPAAFAAAVRDLAGAIHALPPAEGTDAVLLPGERGAQAAAARAAGGIPLAAGTVARLAELAGRLAVPLPQALA